MTKLPPAKWGDKDIDSNLSKDELLEIIAELLQKIIRLEKRR